MYRKQRRLDKLYTDVSTSLESAIHVTKSVLGRVCSTHVVVVKTTFDITATAVVGHEYG